MTSSGSCCRLAYVLLFTQAFAMIVVSVDLAGQIAALALVTATLAFGSLTAKAASSDAVLAGSAGERVPAGASGVAADARRRRAASPTP